MPIINIRSTDQFKAELEKRAELDNTTVSQMIRDVMGRYLDGRLLPIPRGFPVKGGLTFTFTDPPEFKK